MGIGIVLNQLASMTTALSGISSIMTGLGSVASSIGAALGKAFAFAFRKPTKLLYLLTDCLLVQELVNGKGDTPEMIREAWVEGPKSDEDRSKIRKANCYYSAETAEKIRL